MALAKLATLHCGQDIVDWGDFADAVALFVAKFDTIHKLARKSHEPLGNVRAGAYNLVAVINDYLRKSKDDKVERLETLEILVSRLLSFDATDPRDTIYAVLSLAKDTVEGNPDNASQDNALLFVPDYKKSEVDVFKDFIEFAIKSSESLDIICRHWAPVIKEKDSPPTPQHKRRKGDAPARKRLPSWIPSVSRSPYGSPEDALLGRVYGDSFVGTSERKTYNTAPKTIAIWRFGEEPTDLNSSSSPSHRNADSDGESRGSTGFASSPLPNPFTQQIGNSTGPERKSRSNGSMFAKGFRLDSIKELSARFVKGVIPRECLEMAGWITSDYDDKSDIPQVPDELWRTMVADRDSKANNPPPYYQRACQNCLAGSLRGDIEITKMIDDEQDDMTIEFLKRVESVIWNRKFLKSAGKKYSGPRGNLVPKQLFGLAPDLAREKDIICILLGCSVPVILREHRKPKRHFELIGEAYIYGMMGGEALGGRKMEELKKQCEEFELR